MTIINSAGAGNYTDTFVYTAAASTVPPIGNVTVSPTGAAASASNLQPNPANLQVRVTNFCLPLFDELTRSESSRRPPDVRLQVASGRLASSSALWLLARSEEQQHCCNRLHGTCDHQGSYAVKEQ